MSSWDEDKFEAGRSQWPFEEELGPDPNPEYKGKWEVRRMRCKCGKTQVSVHPAICTRVECSGCHKWIRL